MSISKVSVSNTEHQIVGSPRYATCSTVAATAAKVASIADSSSTFVLEKGVRICVKFTYANSASSSTLNVESTGAKSIYWHGAALSSSQYWQAGAVIDFVYNGTQWELVGVAKDNNTTYSLSSFGVTASATELNYTKGVTSSIQTQLNNKAASTHTHAYLPTAGGTMTGAVTTKGIKLTENTDYGDTLPSNPTKGQLFLQTGTNTVLDMVYPVGSIYMSVTAVDPSTLFGGTWEQIKDRFLLAAGITYTGGATGGEATHKLTVSEMPDHGHSVAVAGGTDSYGTTRTVINSFASKTSGWTDSSTVIHTGDGAAHNNMPPYLVVYIWKRTA